MLGRMYEGQDCSIARALEIVGDRWTLLVLRDTSFGLKRFDEFQQSLGIAPNVLTDRLKRLDEEGLVERVMYQESPERFEYLPTQKALDLQPVIFHLAKWGDRYCPDPLGPPRLSYHADCGGKVNDKLRCGRCKEDVWFDSIYTEANPTHRKVK